MLTKSLLFLFGLLAPGLVFSFNPGLSEECQTVLSDLSPRQDYTCVNAQPAEPYSREQVDALHGDGYFDYIWGLAVEATNQHGGSPGLLMALLMKESHFMPTAVSCTQSGRIAASGIAQIIVPNAGGAEAIAQLSNSAEPIYEEIVRQRQAEDPNFVPPQEGSEARNYAKFQWVWGIDSHNVDSKGIEAFNDQGRVCETTNESGSLRNCRSSLSGPSNGLRGLPGCFEAIKRVCEHHGNIRSNLFCPNYSITLAAVYLAHLSEDRDRRAANPRARDLIRAVIGRYNNAGNAEKFCHVHAIAGRGGGFGGTHAAFYCSYENEFLNSGAPAPAQATDSGGGVQ